MTCSHMSYFFISKQLLWELFFRISNSKAIYREIPFDNISLEEKYKSSLNGLSFCRTQSATDMPAKDALALLINVRSSAEWGMQYVLSSRGAIFTRKIADGVFSEWIQV